MLGFNSPSRTKVPEVLVWEPCRQLICFKFVQLIVIYNCYIFKLTRFIYHSLIDQQYGSVNYIVLSPSLIATM